MNPVVTGSKDLRVWIEGAIVAALAIILSLIPLKIGSSFSVSLGMIPLTIYGIRRGLVPGLLSGLVWGLLHFATGDVTYLTVSQVLIEYVVAFTFAGFSGLFSKKIQEKNSISISSLIVSTLVGGLARYFWHFIAGVIFWGKYAMWGMSPVVFSLVMNGISCLATCGVTIGVLILLNQMMPSLFIVKK